MSASEAGLAGGILGAVAGFFIGSPAGASLGFALGSAAGSALGSKPPGPQLNIAKFNGQSYGTALDIVMGTDRRAGVMIECQDPNVQQASSGKGGQSQGSATETFAVALHDGQIVSVPAVWADGALVYDMRPGSTFNNDLPVTFYLGTGSQMPDPTLEAIHGAGFVPAYRHTAYAVFNQWDITKWGRIPNLNFLICESAGSIPWRVSTYSRINTGSNAGGVSYDVNTGLVTHTRYAWLPSMASPVPYTTEVRKVDGTLVSTSTVNVPSILSTNLFSMASCDNDASIWYQCVTGPQNSWFINGVETLGGILTDAPLAVHSKMAYYNDSLYVVGTSGSQSLYKYPAKDGFPQIIPTAAYALTGATSNYFVTVSDDGFIYVWSDNGALFIKLDADLNLLRTWSMGAPAATSYSFAVYGDQIVWMNTAGGGATFAEVLTMNADDTFTSVGEIPIAIGDVVGLGNGLVSVADGIVSINPPPILITYEYAFNRLGLLSGLDATQYDGDELTQPLYGYTIDNQMPCQSAATPLMGMDQFDVVDRAGVLTAVRRGHNPVAQIPDSDLGSTDDIGNPKPLLTVVRAQEEDLPQTLNITYPNIGSDYQPNTQYARIEATRSQSIVTLPVAVILDDDTALATAQTLLYNARMEREKITFTTTRKWSWLEPTDCVNCHGYTLRITAVTYMATGLIEFTARPTNFGLWLSSSPTGAAAQGFKGSTPTPKQASSLILLDIPLVTDTDPIGFYFAMAGSASSAWNGATLYRSTDGGVNYTKIATQITASTIGVASNALGNWSGGNRFDESNSLTVTVGAGGGTFPAFTRTAVLNGAGMLCVGGKELVQYRDSDLIAPGVYLLTGLRRGMRGTEWAIPGHIAAETVVALPAASVPGATSDLGRTWLYKAVTGGQTLGSATPLSFTWTGVSLAPYSLCHIGGGPNSAGDVTINAVRRTRIGGAWVDFNDVPLSEAVESYVWNFGDSTFASVARSITTATPTVDYLDTMQVTDLGAQQEHIYGTVAQVGSYGPGQPTAFVIPGLGSVDGTVITPIRPPFTPPPARGCTIPVQNSSLNWSTPGVSIYSPELDPTMEWVVSFTTGSIVGGSAAGTIEMAEIGGGPIERNAVLSDSPCGNPLAPSCLEVSVSPTFPYFMTNNPNPALYPTLLPFTTYYISVNSSAVGAMFAQLQLPH